MSTELDEQARQEALNQAYYEKRQYEQQKREKQAKYDDNAEKIDRLKEAKKTLKQIKDRLEERAKQQKKDGQNLDTYYEWTGEHRNNAEDMYASIIPSEYLYYIYMVDNVLDAICDEETRLENDNMDLLGIIGKLAGWINSLGNEIQKLLN